MSIVLNYSPQEKLVEVSLPSSKSISNRLLIAQALAEGKFELYNLSEAQDTKVLIYALNSSNQTIDIGMAGTAFRFLTAYFSLQDGVKTLTGDSRMKQRPIAILVDQLKGLGADIQYLEKKGFPPLEITGNTKLKGGRLSINAGVSSQYISALMLIAPHLSGGLQLSLEGEIVSSPYIRLTADLQQQFGLDVTWAQNVISIGEGSYSTSKSISVEADWSSAAFFYQLVALSGKSIFITHLKEHSLQGDKACVEIFNQLGVETLFSENGAHLTASKTTVPKELKIDMTEVPDLIPSVAVTASQLLYKVTISGTKTLYIKECNRVEALKTELAKVGAVLTELNGNSFEIHGKRSQPNEQRIQFSTYNDHRIVMCLAPLSVVGKIVLENEHVVSKSFPNYWKELEKFGIKA